MDHRARPLVLAGPGDPLPARPLLPLAASLLGQVNAASAYSRTHRLAALAFVTVELLIPTWIDLDVQRRPEATSTIWVHAAAMPLVDLFGLFGYLWERRCTREELQTNQDAG